MFASGKTAAVASAANYIEDVFSTYLYTGASASQTITNGIDLSTYGGLVVIKGRSTPTGSSAYGGAANQFTWQDTVRGITQTICSNRTDAQLSAGGFASNSSISTSGFTLDYNGYNDYNRSPNTYASWTFRKQPKFFDVVTYTGNGSSSQAISHSLGSVPACVIFKKLNNAEDWTVWHRSLSTDQYLILNSTSAVQTLTGLGPAAGALTSTTITVPEYLNSGSQPFVAYLFAHNAGGFGLTGTDNVISCGSYTGTGSPVDVNLGYEAQWVLIKRTDSTGNWYLMDTMRGMSMTNALWLYPNTSGAEVDPASAQCNPTATGFTISSTGTGLNASGTYIYIAIRRGPMKVPTSGTSVYNADTTITATTPAAVSGFVTDLMISTNRTNKATYNEMFWSNRLTANGYTSSTNTTAEQAGGAFGAWDTMNGSGTSTLQSAGVSDMAWMFQRAPSFFDEVCYTGTGSLRTVSHNLGAVPELLIVKRRDTAEDWNVYSATTGNAAYLRLNTTAAVGTAGADALWGSTTPTSSVFTVKTSGGTNASGGTFVAYLFATCAGVSKVGSYTGTGTTKQIDCGFTGGARFVLIKRTDSTGDWYVWDTARGIVSGNDPYLLLNSTAAEVTNTDYVDTYSAGFEISSTAPAAINASGGTFIFLAIA